VDRIRAGDPAGLEELYRVFSRGIRFHLCRQLGSQEIDDRLHDTFLTVVQAIQHGELREPERLMGFVRTIVRRQVACYIDRAVHVRRDYQDIESTEPVPDVRETPEERVISKQRAEIVESVLRGISRRDREILTRFYLLEQSQQQICSEMDLSDTQFRLLKSRAKARFGKLGKKKLVGRPLVGFFLRKAAGSRH
jgi:RNA polymerase sigma factor (sigma-70 family)